MATHSSVLAWRIPGMGEPGGLLPMGSYRVRHDWSNLAAAAYIWASQEVPVVTNPPANAGDVRMQVRFMGQQDPLEKGMATHSSILAWEISWTEELSGLQSMGSQRVGHNLATEHCGHVNPSLPIHPTLLSLLWYPYVCSLHRTTGCLNTDRLPGFRSCYPPSCFWLVSLWEPLLCF